MNSCVIFACSIIPGREFVLERFITAFENEFINADFYIGVNPVNADTIVQIIEKSALNFQISMVAPELYTQSDASAYQAALKMLRDSRKKYDNYWFVHTKSGFNSHSDHLRDWYINNLLHKRTEIENFIAEEGVGSYGLLGAEYDTTKYYPKQDVELPLWENIINDDLPFTHAHFFYIHTLYVVAHKPMEKFLQLVTDTWFESLLTRYYFEGVFPFIVSRAGYFPYIENIVSMNGINLQPYQQDWLRVNRLEDTYNVLLGKHKTDYSFHQLEPPYVNSNP